MKNRLGGLLVGAALAMMACGQAKPAKADIIFFANDAAGFVAAQTASGNTTLGTETFEQSTVAPGTFAVFDDPLTQGVPNGPFPTGLTVPMTIQSNVLGGAATSPSPGGTSWLPSLHRIPVTLLLPILPP